MRRSALLLLLMAAVGPCWGRTGSASAGIWPERAEARRSVPRGRSVAAGTHRVVKSAARGKRVAPSRHAPGKAPPSGTVTRAAPAPPQKPAAAPEAAPAAREAAVATTPRGPTRIDFDDRLIQGQTNKSGAVYLFDRKESSLRSMVHRRTSFRDEIAKDVLD